MHNVSEAKAFCEKQQQVAQELDNQELLRTTGIARTWGCQDLCARGDAADSPLHATATGENAAHWLASPPGVAKKAVATCAKDLSPAFNHSTMSARTPLAKVPEEDAWVRPASLLSLAAAA
jgi:hypothetical protein